MQVRPLTLRLPSMKPEDIFGLVVRFVGLAGIVYSLTIAFLFIGTGLPLVMTIKFIVAAIVSLWLLRGAPQLVHFAYPQSQ